DADAATRDAEAVLVTGIELQHVARAAVRVRVALHRLQAADRAGRRARVAVVAATHRVPGLLAAHDIRERVVGVAGTAAAVGVLVAELAGGAASARRLADQHARRTVREAGAAAALTTARRQRRARIVRGTVTAHLAERCAAGGSRRRHDLAGTERRAVGFR